MMGQKEALMELSVDRVVELTSAIIQWLALALVKSAAAIGMVTLAVMCGVLYCLVVFLLTGRLPWMVRKYL